MSASARYYECIEDTFEDVENRLEALESDPDITVAEGVINVTFANRVVFVFSGNPLLSNSGWQRRGVAFILFGRKVLKTGWIQKPSAPLRSF